MEKKTNGTQEHKINKFIKQPPSQNTLSGEKAEEYPASLNRIPKNNNPQ